MEESLLCISCLCVGRSLKVLHEGEYKRFVIDILKEVPLANLTCLAPEICWECEAIIKKSLKFREQVKNSYRILQTYTVESLRDYLLSDVSRPPRLKVFHNKPIFIKPPNYQGIEEIKIEYKDVTNLDDKESQQSESDCDINKEEIQTVICDVKSELSFRNRNEEDVCESGNVVNHKKKLGTNLNNKVSQECDSDINKEDIQIDISDVKYECNLRRDGIVSVHTTDSCDVVKENQVAVKEENLSETDILMADDSTCSSYRTHKNRYGTTYRTERRHKTTNKTQKISKIGNRISKHDHEADSEKDEVSLLAVKAEEKFAIKHRKKAKEQDKTPELKINERTKPYKKNIVSKIIITYDEMLEERRKQTLNENYLKSKFKCESCIVVFVCASSYRKHLETNHCSDIGEFTCPICKTNMSSRELLASHYKRHLTRYQCGICQDYSLDINKAREHYNSMHAHSKNSRSTKEYKCDLCGNISLSIGAHRYHKDTHKARVPCGDCDKTFSHRAGLMNHRIVVHEYKNEFPCNVCKKVFRWKNSLRRHLVKHTNDQDSSCYCETCGIGFSSVSSLQRHLRNSLKHVTPDQLRYICDHCNRRFVDKTKLRDHIEDKHLQKTKSYQCYICHKPSKSRVGLDQHIRNVHKGRPNNKICHHCGKGFPTKVQLESHIRTHTGERPFICEFCPTTFSQQSNLYKHHRQVHQSIRKKKPILKKTREEVHVAATGHEDPSMPIAVIQYMTLPENVFGI